MQKLKAVFLFFSVLYSFNVTIAQTQNNVASGPVLTLKECVDIAIKNNLAVNQSDLLMQTGSILWKQSKDYLLPNLNASGSQQSNFGRSLNPYTYTYLDQQNTTGGYGLSANLTLFSGFQLQNSIKQFAYAYDASKLDLQQQKDLITVSVLLAYLQILGSQELLDIGRRQADIDAKQVERLEVQNKEGGLPLLSTLSDLKGQYAGDLANIDLAVNTLETAKINLFQLLNIPLRKDITYEPLSSNINITEYGLGSDSIYQTALQILPLVKSADLKIKSSQKALAAMRSLYYPTLSLYGSVNTSYSSAATTEIPGATVYLPTQSYVTVSGTNYPLIVQQQNTTTEKITFGDQFKNNRYTSIGLSLTVPIFNWFRVRNNVKTAKVNLKTAEINARNIRLVLQQNVEQAYQNMISAYGQYKAYVDQVDAYNESFRSAEIRFNEGVINSDIYLIAKNNADRAVLNLSSARYNYLFRTKILDYYLGKLTY